MTREEAKRELLFVELPKREYERGRYISTNMLIAIDDISRVVQCTDNYELTNIVTKDGKIHTIADRYENVVKKIRYTERREEGDE